MKSKVLLVDDVPVVIESLTRIFNSQSDLMVCGSAGTFSEVLKTIGESQPHVIVLALELRDGDGVELIRQIRIQQKAVPIVVFSKLEESAYALRVLKAGGQGFVSKQQPVERLVEAIRTVVKGGYAVSPQISTRFLQSVLHSPDRSSATPADILGDQELKVFGMLGQGAGTRDIAAKLGISVKTVETYRARIKEKLRLPDTSSLIREAVRWNESRG